ncbi:hypothetical protein, conserved [Entamoeba dispar SAW760]|uniref:Uncharacterized protein n=1 Tax=Entamoeba dispar (strain ATCC PRA-260 / SAW760) TaxID=370354 RepID=B0EUY9_ENTDS|nr:uncharacterized protein EDI_242310 [Entamoeba dispar SAW760]EDR21650.1 hypothetical protein, conserved [Entamoeba dispar SAW760]|eukprot:EDR21650.1 hypothetical protein, conserved [Entamoeba dispar SAW760]
MSNSNPIYLKSLLIGNSQDVKQRMMKLTGNSTKLLKIGVNFKFVTTIIDRVLIKMQVWDIAGQERFRTITESFISNAHIIYFVYNIIDASTFRFIQTTLEQVNQRIGCNSMGVLVGFGCEEQREVSNEEIMELSLKYQIKHYEFDLSDDSQLFDLYFKTINQFITENPSKFETQTIQSENQHSSNKCVVV